jgi:hypothetical protein
MLRNRPDAAVADGEALIREFINSVPLNRWTWTQHHYLQASLGDWREAVERRREELEREALEKDKSNGSGAASRPTTAPSSRPTVPDPDSTDEVLQ